MWGKHVETELAEAQHKAKNETQAKQKIQMVVQRLLTEKDEEDDDPQSGDSESPRPIQPGRFADPAARMKR